MAFLHQGYTPTARKAARRFFPGKDVAPKVKTFWFTGGALVGFAGNSLLCRLALEDGSMDPASFTTARLLAGALTLSLLARGAARPEGSAWASGLALFAYASFFSFAYVEIPAATGALLLFAAVQTTMIAGGVARGERVGARQWLGLLVAGLGVWALLAPGVEAAPLGAAVLMSAAGIAWGVYSLRGRRASNPLMTTTASFVVAAPLSLGWSALTFRDMRVSIDGVALALASGALASGLGYVLWHRALARFTATRAAASQLVVPVLAAIGGVVVLSETPSLRLLLSSLAVLGGVGLTMMRGSAVEGPSPVDAALDVRIPGIVPFSGASGGSARSGGGGAIRLRYTRRTLSS
jgi:drug/metabolite transporter (DMT)-like permease